MPTTFWSEDVVGTLEAAISRADAGQPTILDIEGAPGTGKTTLLSELCERATDFVIAVAEGLDTAMDAYGVLAQWGVEVHTGTDGAQLEPIVVAGDLRTLVERLGADGRPVLLRLDDLHWADHESIEAVSWLIRRASGERLLVAVSARPAPGGETRTGSGRWPLSGESVLPVRLEGLTPEGTALLVHQRWPEATPEMTHRLWQHTGGNPLYLAALLEERSTEELAPMRVLPAPVEYARDVATRLSRQSSEAIRLAEALAVLGSGWMPFRDVAALAQSTETSTAQAPAAAAASELPGDAASGAAQQLSDGHLLALGEMDGAPVVRFSHALVRSAIYQHVPLPRRRALHAAAARTVTGRTAAFEHRLAAADRYDDLLATELDESASELYRQHAYRLSAQHYRWSSSVTGDVDNRQRRWLESQFSALLAQEYASVETQLPVIRDSADLARRTLIEGAWHCLQTRFREGVQVLSTSDAWPAALGDPLTRSRLDVLLAWGRTLLGHDTSLVAAALSRVDARRVHDPALTAYALMARGHVAGRTGERAGFAAQLDLLPAVAAATPVELTGLLRWRGLERLFRGYLAGSVSDLTEVHLRQHDGRADMLSNGVDSMLATAHWFAGNWDLSRVYFRANLDAPPADVGVLTHALAALPASGAGEFDQADVLLREGAVVLDERPWQEAIEAYVLVLVTRAHAGGSPEQRRTLLGEVRRRWPHASIGAGYVVGLLAVHFAMAQVWAGELSEADATLGQVDRLEPRAECLDATAIWVRSQLAEAQGDGPVALSLVRQASELDCTALPLFYAHIHADHARLASAAGSAAEARSAHQQAELGYRALGAGTYLARLDPSSPPASPGIMLTEREHDVLTLLVGGYSYAQISRDLFISEKTVGYHLSNVYAKAGVGSRHELVDWVRTHPGAITIGSARRRK